MTDENSSTNAAIRAGTWSSRSLPDDDEDAEKALADLAEAAAVAAKGTGIDRAWNNRIRSAAKRGLRR